MAHRKSFTVIIVSILIVIPLMCGALNKRDTEPEDSSSGEEDIPRPRQRLGYGGSPTGGEEKEEGQSTVVQEGQGQDPATGQEESAEQSTTSPEVAVGGEMSHIPRQSDVEDEERGVEEESVESTTLLSAAVPLAPIPSEEQDSSSHQSQAQQPSQEENLSAGPSQTVIIWDGTSEPEREHTAARNESAGQPEQPASQQDQTTSQPKQSNDQPEEPVSKPEQRVGHPEEPASQPEQPGNQPNQPFSQELQGGANGNGQSKEPPSDSADKSSPSSDQRGQEQGRVPVSGSDTSSGSTLSSSMAWVVVFVVVSSALLISGMGDSEAERGESSCYLGCRHNFTDFNPYAWPPTPVNPSGSTRRPVT